MTQHEMAYKEAIKQQDLKHAVNAIRELNFDELGLLHFYENDIVELMNEVDSFSQDEGAIWREHVRSELILESMTHLNPYIETMYGNNAMSGFSSKVMLLSPEGENHILGLRMMQDLLKANGHSTFFPGADLPNSQVTSIMNFYRPKWVIISVTNAYHLLAAKKAVRLMRSVDPGIAIIGTGHGFIHNPEAISEVIVKPSFSSILALVGGKV